MFDFDDMIRDFAIALAIVFVAFGSGLSIYFSFQYDSSYSRVLAVVVGCIWVYISFRLVRFFRMWALREEIRRKNFFLRYMDDSDPDRPAFLARRTEAIQQLDEFQKG